MLIVKLELNMTESATKNCTKNLVLAGKTNMSSFSPKKNNTTTDPIK
ncbi:hypothetical protein GCM10022388_20650 [Flavobacterium chungnamense]|uniref:Uncharacterized protein n=1 Tax=Flavobacterium chungnamense TaxID=706182 RepID=A0ABP7UVR9_9FLAO